MFDLQAVIRRHAQPAEGAISVGHVLESVNSGISYTAERQLGSGSFGAVWLCRESTGGEHRAVKVLDASKADDVAQEVQLFQRAWEAIGDERCPRLYEASDALTFGQQGVSHIIISMEFLDGMTASQMASFHDGVPRMAEYAASGVVGDVCKALEKLHSAGIVHRDVKGDNAMVLFTGRAVLCDFGCSARVRDLEGDDTLAGTPDFMAPELLGRAPIWSTKMDVWALGVFTREIVFGKTPAQEKRIRYPQHCIEWIATSKAPKCPLPPGYPDTFCTAVEKCMTRDRNKRPTMREIYTTFPFFIDDGQSGVCAIQEHFRQFVPVEQRPVRLGPPTRGRKVPFLPGR